jgi:hypothetical protein
MRFPIFIAIWPRYGGQGSDVSENQPAYDAAKRWRIGVLWGAVLLRMGFAQMDGMAVMQRSIGILRRNAMGFIYSQATLTMIRLQRGIKAIKRTTRANKPT